MFQVDYEYLYLHETYCNSLLYFISVCIGIVQSCQLVLNTATGMRCIVTDLIYLISVCVGLLYNGGFKLDLLANF